jgi:hypothetical protein
MTLKSSWRTIVAESNNGPGPWGTFDVNWSAHCQAVEAAHRKVVEGMAIPKELLEDSGSNYASAIHDAVAHGYSPLNRAIEHAEMLRKLRESISDRSISSANAYLILPPEMKQEVAFLREDMVAEPAMRVTFRHRMDYMPMLYNRFAMTDIGGSEPRKPKYKPRPAVAEVPPATGRQWAVLFGVGVLILLMMLSAARSL